MTVLLYEDPKAGYLKAIEFDAVVTEVHSIGAQATEHPIERGAPISDHVRPSLVKVTMEGTITNTPLLDAVLGGGLPDTPLQIRGANAPIVLVGATKKQVTEAQVMGGWTSPYKLNGFRTPHSPITTTAATWVEMPTQVGGHALQFPVQQNRVQMAYEILTAIAQNGWLVTLSTALKEYPEMVLLTVDAPRIPEDSLTFHLEFQEFRFVDTQGVTIQRKAPKAEKRAQAVEDKGVTAVEDDFAEPDSDLESLASQGTGLGG